MISASDHYHQRVSTLEQQLKRITTINRRFYFSRLALFVVTVAFVVLFIKFEMASVYMGFAFLSFVLFLISITLNHKYLYKEKQIASALNVNKQELEYLDFKFSDKATGDEYTSMNPYLAEDFDLFGKSSLYQYLNRCVTFLGKKLFASGLVKAELDAEMISNRQQAIKDLSYNRMFVENFHTFGGFLNEKGDEIENINNWLNEKEENLGRLKIAAIVCPAIILIWILMIVLNVFNFGSLVFPIIVNLIVIKQFNKKITKAHSKLGKTAKSFKMYSTLIKLIENKEFKSPYLIKLQQQLQTENIKASDSLKSLFRLITNFDVRYNVFLSILLNSFFVFDLHVLSQLEKWKIKNKNYVAGWFNSLTEMDEMISYAVFSFNNKKQVVYPELSDADFEFSATDLGHPLLDPDIRVTNTVKLIGRPNIVIITGANMAGKSTFLRTLSVNMILAMNGAPVCASSFRFTPCDIMSSIKIQDSLANHESYFYAELLRIKDVIDHAENQPKTFVILDEILRGTNTKDKQLGARGILKKLINNNAVAIIATHDLEIGKLEEEYPNVVSNFCFEVELQDDQLKFDYKLKNGISTKLNASFLMKKMGIVD